ncbi:LOW QUALITY PROTEIN: Reverse transcriptase [Phytophthora palmivora]|uniref:Reverse transcriptase n=1 Tax=Phytophthora palmivora TaxID=4796 RepID=A0A2P4Y7T7_9STRA|nr:LOW QUALITY PROTEIN: Reverse transcriptase [Phytophthora palmivora]
MKRDWNQHAGSLESAVFQRDEGIVIPNDEAIVKITAVTQSRKKCRPEVLQEEIVIDLFTGYVIAKASVSRTAQIVAENYENESSTGSEQAKLFDTIENPIVQQNRGTETANNDGVPPTTERHNSKDGGNINTCSQDRDWDRFAEDLTFAPDTAQDRIRGDTPFYLLHGWDPLSTLEAMGQREYKIVNPFNGDTTFISSTSRNVSRSTRNYAKQSKSGRIDNKTIHPHEIKFEDQVWLCLDRIKEGNVLKLEHMWHGHYRVSEPVNEQAMRLEIAGTQYRLFQVAEKA